MDCKGIFRPIPIGWKSFVNSELLYFHPCSYIYITFCREAIQWEQLILVTGTLKTKHWANAVNFSKQSAGELTFTIGGQGANGAWGDWSGSIPSIVKISSMTSTSGK